MYTTEQIKKMIAKDDVHKFYNDYYWRKISHEIISEQHGECQICKSSGRYGKGVITHHVNHLRDNPELAYSRYYIAADGSRKRNLIAVCKRCHEALHHRGQYKKINQRYKNEEQW